MDDADDAYFKWSLCDAGHVAWRSGPLPTICLRPPGHVAGILIVGAPGTSVCGRSLSYLDDARNTALEAAWAFGASFAVIALGASWAKAPE